MFHILPKLQAKRADFLTVMLTGSLHQRRAFMDTPPETQAEGPRDDDVTKSESDSGESEKSTERSQDGAPSTLLADDPQKGPKEPASVAEVDPDQEDISKTLILFSPGDMRKSPNSGEAVETYQAAATSEAPQTERVAVDGELLESNHPIQEPDGQSKTGDQGLSSSIKQKPNPPVINPSAASPPFTKVERTFIHIAETSHLNIMSSNSLVQECVLEVPAVTENPLCDGEAETSKNSVVTPSEPEGPVGVQSEISSQTPSEEPQVLTVLARTLPGQICREDILFPPVTLEKQAPIFKDQSSKGNQEALPEQPKKDFQPGMSEDDPTKNTVKHSISPRPRVRSRIPVLMPEEDTGPELGLSSREQIYKKAKQQDLARLVVERQRRDRCLRLNSRTSSSLSSGDEPRRASESLSTAGSEEDSHPSDDSLNKVKKEAEGSGQDGWRSRIPRPVTPIKRLSLKTLAAPSPLATPGTSTRKTKQTCNGPRVQSGTGGGSDPHARSKSSLSHSTQAGGSPRMPLRCIFTASRRSLCAAQCTFSAARTTSPSPQRLSLRTAVAEPRRTLLAVCAAPPRSTQHQTPTTPPTGSAPQSRNRTKASTATKTTMNVKKSTSHVAAAAR